MVEWDVYKNYLYDKNINLVQSSKFYDFRLNDSRFHFSIIAYMHTIYMFLTREPVQI